MRPALLLNGCTRLAHCRAREARAQHLPHEYLSESGLVIFLRLRLITVVEQVVRGGCMRGARHLSFIGVGFATEQAMVVQTTWRFVVVEEGTDGRTDV